MGYFYERSTTFGHLKRTQEHILENYSSEQYMNALDTCLHNGMYAILRCSQFLNDRMALLLNQYLHSGNVMYTSFGRKQAVESIQNFLSSEDIEEKFDIVREMRIHRNIIIQWLQDFKVQGTGIRAKFLKMKPVKDLVAATYSFSAATLFCCYPDVTYWLDMGLKLRTQILEKYNRLVVNESRILYVKISHSAELDDIVQLLAIEAMRALDRCNVEKGPLTSYLQQYLKFSGSKIDFEKDSSYVVKGVRTDYAHKSLDLENAMDIGHESDLAAILSVRQIARTLDPKGAARYALGIQEILP